MNKLDFDGVGGRLTRDFTAMKNGIKRRTNILVTHQRSSQSDSQVGQQMRDDADKRRDMKPQFKSKKAMLDQYLKTADPDLRQRKAIRHFMDAMHRRQPRTDVDLTNSRFLITLYEISISPWWSMWIILLTCVFVMQVFLEPTNQETQVVDHQWQNYLVSQETFILFFYLIDCVLSLFQRVLLDETFDQKYKDKKQFVRDLMKFLHGINYNFFFKVVFLCLFIIDEGIFFDSPGHKALRFSRTLRPLWLIFHSKEVSHTLTAMVLSFSRVIDTFIFFILLCLFWAFLGYNMFSGFQPMNPKYSRYDFFFQDYYTSFISLYTLLSMDSYPTIFLYICEDSNWYLLYFVPFTMINLFFLLTLPPAIIFLKYKEQMAKLVLQDKIRVSEALVSCFICLDTNNSGTLTSAELFHFIDGVYKGRAIKPNVKHLFNMIDVDADDNINMEEFLEITDLMEFMPRVYDNAPILWAVFRQFMNQTLKVDKIAKSPAWNFFVLAIVLVNTVIVIYYFVENPSPTAANAIENLDNFFNAVYIFDVVIKIIGYGFEDYFAEPWYQFDFIMVVISITTIIGINYLYFLKKAKSGKLLKIVKAQKALRMVRAIRSIKFFQFMSYGAETVMRIKRLFVKVSICFPIIFRILLTLLYITYVYAIVGISIFNTDTNPHSDGSMYTENDYTNFNSFMGALLALFQVLTQSGWTIFIYDYGYKFDYVSASIYFCTFHLFSVFFMFSLLMGLLWETFYVVDKAFKDEDEMEEEDDHILQSQISHSHVKSMSGLEKEDEIEQMMSPQAIRLKRTSQRNYLVSRQKSVVTLRQRTLTEQPQSEKFYRQASKALDDSFNSSENNNQVAFTSASNHLERKQKTMISPVRPRKGDTSNEPIFVTDHSQEDNLYQWLKEANSYLLSSFVGLDRKTSSNIDKLLVRICELRKPTDHIQSQIEQLEDLKSHVSVIGQYGRLKQADQEKMIQSRMQKKEKLKATLNLNTQNALINQTYLKDYDKNKISQFEKHYLSSYYGQVCEIKDPLITYGSTLGLSNNIMMILRRILRGNGFDLNFFSENLLLVERMISSELLHQGSFIKFLFKFEEDWYHIKRLNQDSKMFTIEPLNIDGFWDFSQEVFNQEGEIYINFDLWKNFDHQSAPAQELILSTVECFKILSNQVSDYTEVSSRENREEVICSQIPNQFGDYILQNFIQTQKQFRNSRTAKASLQTLAGLGTLLMNNIDHEFVLTDIPSQVFILLVRTEQKGQSHEMEEEKGDQSHKHNAQDEINDIMDINLRQLEQNSPGSINKLPLSYVLEVLKDLRDTLYMYQFNLFQRVAELKLISKLNTRIPEQEEEEDSPSSRNSEKT